MATSTCDKKARVIVLGGEISCFISTHRPTEKR